MAEIIEELGDNLFFVCGSASMRKIHSQAKLLATIDIPVLILGENGVGKEVIARIIHKCSSRSNRTFLKVNCAAVPADLLESKLFGDEGVPGKFELCNKGTILIDEIGEMPAPLQAKLQQVLRDQQFSRLGSRTVQKLDVRILAATKVNIQNAIASGKLSKDLYYRLNGFAINVPPLRERKEEIPLLLKHFIQQIAERWDRPPLLMSPALIQACETYDWPGNVRELGNFIKRYMVLGDEEMAISELVPHAEKTQSGGAGGRGLVARTAKDAAEIEAIKRALAETNWNQERTSWRWLKISFRALLYKIREYFTKKKKK